MRSNSKMKITGSDSNGERYANPDALWKKEQQGDMYDKKNGWYGRSLAYWEEAPASVEGVLAGLDFVHEPDIEESRKFIESLPKCARGRALDCGAGVGRISKAMLTNMYATTDLLEPLPHLLEKAKEELAGLPTGEFILSSMENASLPANTYDLILIQWAALYLTDDDFVRFLTECKQALSPNGYIFIKENVASRDEFLVDRLDSSLTRCEKHYEALFKQVGLEVVKKGKQQNWPSKLMPIIMYALQPSA